MRAANHQKLAEPMTLLHWTLTIIGIYITLAAFLFGILQYLNKRGSPKVKVVLWSLLWPLVTILLVYVVGLVILPFQSRKLTILYDETRHTFQGHPDCEIHRIGVRNEGTTTVGNVVLKIASITAEREEQNNELQQLVGLKLSLSDNPRGPIGPRRDNPPVSSVTINPGDEETFDFLGLCKLPGNYRIYHSNYSLTTATTMNNTQVSWWVQRPKGTIPPGKYSVTLSAYGDDLGPKEQQFEFSSTSNSVTFRVVG